ncbi:ABC transporter permease [Dictyobacter formicarum]|uniref:ABC transporter permease n=1 Tax=Dictyobacter formicarum TaxID=2778368 RepID=A0ABQ3VD71_9CHLR|nr:ABC transporter permease [Dictyobacter formicarum]GHO83745.1 ABC transporter permease [Dictyobacter formicarum]
MAMPKVQRRTSAPASRLARWMQQFRAALGRPLIATLVAFVLGGIIVMITTPGPLDNRFITAVSSYYYLLLGSFGSIQSISFTLAKATPLIFAGLAVAIAFRAGLFNIGAAGQLTVGAMTAGIIAFKLSMLPGWVLVPLMLLGSIVAGGFWGGIVGVLKAWRGAHEVVTSIMLNWVAFYVCAYLVEGPFQAPKLSQQTLPLPSQAIIPSLAVFYNETLGTFLPQIPEPAQYTVDVGLLFAFIALVFYWFITARTTFGYELRVIGRNPKAARYAGISVRKNIVLAMVLAGAFAGLAGSVRLMGQAPYQLISSAFATDSTGFDAIGVALLGRTASVGVLLASLLFGGLQEAGPYLQGYVNVPGDIITIMQSLVLFSIAVEYLPSFQRFIPNFLSRSSKPALVPGLTDAETSKATAGVTAESEPVDANGNESTGKGAETAGSAHAPLGQEE